MKKKGRHVFKVLKGKYPKTKAEFESKVTINVYTGGIQTTSGEEINAAGVSENIFGGYNFSPIIGGSVFFNQSNHISLGGTLKYFFMSKPLYLVNNLTIEADFKYHIIKSDRNFSPYVLAGVNFSLLSISQNLNDYSFTPSDVYSVKHPDDILVTQLHYYNPNISLSFLPVPGFCVGAGINAKLVSTISWFVQVEYDFGSVRNNSLIMESFPNNNSNFNYMLISTGINIKFIKSKFLY